MLQDCGKGYGKRLGELLYRCLALRQSFDHGSPSWIGEAVEKGIQWLNIVNQLLNYTLSVREKGQGLTGLAQFRTCYALRRFRELSSFVRSRYLFTVRRATCTPRLASMCEIVSSLSGWFGFSC